MQPHDFIKKWSNSKLKESASSQSHFDDLCDLLGIEKPAVADPDGIWFTYEKGAKKTGGGDGWADVWRRGAFAWEYKGKSKDLDKALSQLLQYSIALESPPLLIVSDMYHIHIHTNWTNTVQKVFRITIEDLVDGATRDLLRNAFLEPDVLKPAKTRQALTEDAAREFASLARRLHAKGYDPHAVAHFINRLVFCMFAEDVRLLPDHIFTKMLSASRKDPSRFQANAQKLFRAMSTGGDIDFTPIDWFNGGLFDNDEAIPLDGDDIRDLIAAADLDWSEIDPSIMGTLFERGLDPDKRTQLGAHYTDRDKIMQIVGPVVIDPLLAEWATVQSRIKGVLDKAPKQTAEKLLRGPSLAARTKAINEAQALHQSFLERLRNFRVLDPACGSGNFLYLSLLALKDIEHKVNLEAEAIGLTRGFPTVGPECVQGIELNPYAAELARVSVWIGEIQWMRRNGFDASRNPVLRNLTNIENRDAVLAASGVRAEWPESDVIIGNPPFLGSRKLIPELGREYVEALRKAYREQVSKGADLVCFWFAKAWEALNNGRTTHVGLIATSSISGGSSRKVLDPIAKDKRIFCAWRDQPWVVDGAAVEVSIICFGQQPAEHAILNNEVVPAIFSDLYPAGDTIGDLLTAKRLIENGGVAFQGVVPRSSVSKKIAKAHGLAPASFVLTAADAGTMFEMPSNPNGRLNRDVVLPYLTGDDITKRPLNRFIVDFYKLSEVQAALFEAPYAYIEPVKTHRSMMSQSAALETWWRHWRERADMRSALAPLKRFIVTPRVSKHRVFVWRKAPAVVDNALVAIAREDDFAFGILQSRHHKLWSLRMGTRLENRPRYTSTTTFGTFPFPEGMTPDLPLSSYIDSPLAEAIGAAAKALDSLREAWLNPIELVEQTRRFDHLDATLEPVDSSAAAALKKRTMTVLYNAPPSWLRNAHADLDKAVSAAYGFDDDLSDEEVIQLLLRENTRRIATTGAAGNEDEEEDENGEDLE